MKLLIVGNGSIGIGQGNKFYINNHTGYFLNNLAEQCEVCFLENSTLYKKDNNLQNFELGKHDLDFKIAPKIKSFLFLPKLLLLMHQYNSVYLFYPGSLSKITALISIFLGKPFGLYIRGQYYKEGILDKFILKRAKYILTVSPTIEEDVKPFCSNVDVIKPMISISSNDFKNDRIYEMKEQWRLLFVGRVEYRKGIYDLVEIARILKSKGVEFVLDIVGGGNIYKEIQKVVAEKRLVANVNLLGLVSDKEQLKDLYNNADAFVFTSHDEGFPRVLYEAMASGLPIFTTFVGGISGRMLDGHNCYEIPVKNPKCAAEVILNRIQGYEDLQYIGESGQSTLSEIINGKLGRHEDLLISFFENENENENEK